MCCDRERAIADCEGEEGIAGKTIHTQSMDACEA